VERSEDNMNREELEQSALDNVCACWAYDLRSQLEETDDNTLHNIIADSQWLHRQNQLENPVSLEEYQAELEACPDYKEAK
jgi:hypothetical protein